MIEPNCFARPTLHNPASILILDNKMVGIYKILWKTLVLHLFHISHEMGMMRDANHFYLLPLV
jgi:hypothetical protein